jgi:phospholipid transport system substrate-binding protein|tara:strand:- start:45 stop:653 length:609 start_codon:yes stop_codon:yes gene_type:complete
MSLIYNKRLVNFFFTIIILLLFIEKSFSIEPNIFIQSTVNRASAALSSSFTKDEKIKELKNIAKETVDIKGIGLYTIGKHRKNMTDEKKSEYLNLFEKYFLKTFSDRLSEYTNPKVQVTGSQKLNENYTIVSSVLIATKERGEVQVDWRVYTKDPQNLAIRDLIIEGLSLARTQKEEFNSIIQSNNGDINALFDSIRNFINN